MKRIDRKQRNPREKLSLTSLELSRISQSLQEVDGSKQISDVVQGQNVAKTTNEEAIANKAVAQIHTR